MKEKLAHALSRDSEAGVAGVSTSPGIKLLIAAAVVSLLAVGMVTLFLVLFRPIEEEATVELSTEARSVEEPPIEVPTA